MQNRIIRLFLILVIGIINLTGCAFKASPIGNHNEILVIADDYDWLESIDAVKSVFEIEIKTPQVEKRFRVVHPPAEYIQINKKHRNLLILGTLETGGVVGDILKSMITPEVRKAINSGEYIYVKKNEFARNQIMITIIAPTLYELNTKLYDEKHTLYNIINNSVNRNLSEGMFKKNEQVELSKKILNEHGFTFRIQHDYIITREDGNKKVLWLRRFNPDRMIFVHWIDTTDVGVLSNEWVKDKRNELGRNFMDNSKIFDGYTEYQQTDFLGYVATEIRGGWWQEEKFLGGPLLNYTFYDDYSKRIYMIDLMVFAPEQVNNKEPLIRQLEIIAQTFITNERTN